MSGIDLSQVKKLGNDLGRIAAEVLPDVEKVLDKGALNIKQQMNTEAAGSVHFKGMAGSVTYDSYGGLGLVRRVIGPDKSRQGGSLGNIAYFGTSRGGGTLDIEAPLREEGPRTEKALLDLVKKYEGQL